jgi:hypothetical protein
MTSMDATGTDDGAAAVHEQGVGIDPIAEAPFHWGELRGVSIDFPMVVERMHSATLSYTVPLDAARALVPGDAFEVAEAAPGTATFVLALVDYVENPWGDYDEVNFGLLVHPVGRPEQVGAFVYRMPVDQEFTKEAGNRVLGLPKTVEDLRIEYPEGRVEVHLAMGGRHVMSVRLPRAPAAGPSELTPATTYSYLDGVPTELPLGIELGSALIDPSEVEVELGDSPVADELRSLGLPGSPDFVAWGEDLRGVFARPRPL